jgi:hypothetical protein
VPGGAGRPVAAGEAALVLEKPTFKLNDSSLFKIWPYVAETTVTDEADEPSPVFPHFDLTQFAGMLPSYSDLSGLFSVPAPLFGPLWAVQRGFFFSPKLRNCF